jgi:exocyst complex component 3
MVTSLRGMYSRLSHISDLLALDSQHLLGPSPNLLPIHYHLTELETFRNETLAQARRSQSSAASKRTLEQYFERLGTTIDQFELHYFKICGQFLALARAGNAAVAVKIAKIAVLEGTRDRKALEVRTLKGTGTTDVAMMHKSMQAEARTIKNYKEKVIEAIELSCKLAIEASFAKYHEDGIAWIEDLDWIFDDLVLVEKELISRFPEDWKIHEI